MSVHKMIEEKHRFRQGLIMRNRAYATLIPGDPHPKIAPVMLAKGSVSPPRDCEDQNAYMVDLYLNRRPGQRTSMRPFVSVRDQWIKEMDVFRIERETALNLEPDFKRRPVRAHMMPARDGEHLAFETVPWETMGQAELVRNLFDGWRKTRCLKTVEDYEDFEDLMLTALTFARIRSPNTRLNVNITETGSVGVLQRMFLRAYVQELAGLQRSYGYQEVADILSSFGCQTSRDDVKNAIRAKFHPRIVPRTSRVKLFMGRLMLAFEGLEPDAFLAPFDP